ncbi:hypothetical protein [uncultured Ilyobacter sp.]|uniref:hypothetical protein n=1 Tax=uncultured Ilyobacter sp. TaxID=544433 RepID=UPI0029C00A9D|nr:hypothetical protein [uncultured Ilyobacter sp.]
MNYKINITSCKGCEGCVFDELKDIRKVLKNGELLIKSEDILSKKCDAVEKISD